MFRQAKWLPGINGNDLVHAIAENETPVEHRNARFLDAQEFTVEINHDGVLVIIVPEQTRSFMLIKYHQSYTIPCTAKNVRGAHRFQRYQRVFGHLLAL